MTNNTARKGPFGLWQGMQLDDFNAALLEVAPCKYKTSNPPKIHSAFEEYVLQITPRSGLSWIKAIGRNIASNRYGHELLSTFESMEAKLSGVYGKSDRTDGLLDGSIWNEPQDWMTSLQNGERILAASWESNKGVFLPDSLVSVFLIAKAIEDDLGFISVEYSFKNAAQSDAEIAIMEDDAL